MVLLALWLACMRTQTYAQMKCKENNFQVSRTRLKIRSALYYLGPVLVNIFPAFSHSHFIWHLHMTHFILGKINLIENYYKSVWIMHVQHIDRELPNCCLKYIKSYFIQQGINKSIKADNQTLSHCYQKQEKKEIYLVVNSTINLDHLEL